MSDDNKRKITFNPEFFNNFEGTQEELDALVAQLTVFAENIDLDIAMAGADEIEINGKLILDNGLELDEVDIAEIADRASERYGLDNNGFVKYPFTLH